MIGGGLMGSPIAGGVLGQVMSGAGASTAGNMGTQPYSDARNSGGYTDPSGSGNGMGTTYGNLGGGQGTHFSDAATSAPSAPTSSPDAYRGDRRTAQTTSNGGK
jgi:hypothetical protein